MERRTKTWRRLEEVVRAELAPRDGFGRVLGACSPPVPRALRAELARLPFEEERNRLALWLLGLLEREPPPDRVEQLHFRIATCEWRGRPDGADLELAEGGPPHANERWQAGGGAGSAVLARLARLLPFAEELEPSPGTMLALAYAALAVQEMLARMDPALVLGAREERSVAVAAEGGLHLVLGRFTAAGWDRSGFGLCTLR